MIIYLCIKFQSNTPILSKDIAWKPKVLRTGRTDGTDIRTDSGDTICTPIENGGGIKMDKGSDKHKDADSLLNDTNSRTQCLYQISKILGAAVL